MADEPTACADEPPGCADEPAACAGEPPGCADGPTGPSGDPTGAAHGSTGPADGPPGRTVGVVSRRGFLVGAAALAGVVTGAGVTGAASTARRAPGDPAGRAVVPFHGAHQAGVATPPPAFLTLLAFDLLPGVDRDALRRLLRIWTDDAVRLTRGEPGLVDLEPELAAVPASLTVTVGFGPRVFDVARLTARRPAWLAPLPSFGIDDLRREWSDGDVALQLCADDPVTLAHAARVLVRQASTFAAVRWVQRGYRNAPGTVAPGTTMRNLFGQVDGTRNLVPGRDDDLIWVADGPLAGGTGMVVRRIAMNLTTWEQLDRPAREQVVGRRLSDGAPLTGRDERDEPDLAATGPDGLTVIPGFAHIRRARTDDPRQRFLRRGYNYDDGAGRDAGLVFITFQADVAEQFVPVQRRLDELDLMNTWTTPIGSAVFVAPGGVAPGEYVGQRLLEG